MRYLLAVGCLLGLTWVSPALLAQEGLLGLQEGANAPRSVTIDVVIASGPREAGPEEMTAAALLELAGTGKLDWVTRLRLATVENDRAHVQVGERAPVVTGRMQRGGFPGGEAAQSVTTLVNVGTTVEAISQIAADGSIVIALTAEKSWLEPAPAAEGGEGPPAQQPPSLSRTLNAKVTVHVKPGEPTLVTAQSSSAGKSNSQTWIVLTASASGDSKPAATEKEASVLKVFHLKFAKADDVAKVLEAVFDKQPLKASADERTNSVLVQAPFITMEMVQAILKQLDAAQPKE